MDIMELIKKIVSILYNFVLNIIVTIMQVIVITVGIVAGGIGILAVMMLGGLVVTHEKRDNDNKS